MVVSPSSNLIYPLSLRKEWLDLQHRIQAHCFPMMQATSLLEIVLHRDLAGLIAMDIQFRFAESSHNVVRFQFRRIRINDHDQFDRIAMFLGVDQAFAASL